MDLVYASEVLTYGMFRNHQYRDYEQPWNNDYFNNGRSTQNYCHRLPQQHHERKELSRENCHLCRESKRRSLAVYIRGKSRRSTCEEIHEEEEDTTNIKSENACSSQGQLLIVKNESLNTSGKSEEIKEK
ncbi:uncharacterized protein LOC143186732 [Calliopsis andreniformis]|uniref:uncharacterized protein LOC143186732 n=1 Tax=Calliopsis andreniformis TaxID=337506 RepID=UPI003FCD0D98